MDYTLKQKIKEKSGTGIFDQIDMLPDMSLKELYHLIKASRRKMMKKIKTENRQAHSMEQ